MRPDYSRISKDYDCYRSFSDELMDKYLTNFVDLANLHGREKILDGGAGTGRFSLPLSKNFKVTAIDCSKEMIQIGHQKSGKIRWVQGDIVRTPFKSGYFDCVLLAYVIHQLPDFHAAIDEIARISRKCIIITTDMHRRLPTLLDYSFPSLIKIDRERFPPIEEIQGALILAGFEKVRARRILLEQRTLKKDYMEKVHNKYLSTFDFITEDEFKNGVRKLEELFAKVPGDHIMSRGQATFVSGSNL